MMKGTIEFVLSILCIPCLRVPLTFGATLQDRKSITIGISILIHGCSNGSLAL
jgi:hypothetical protein